jgi:hypothetical protein
MNETDYPGLFQEADAAARSAQKKHISIALSDLLLLVLAAAISALPSTEVSIQAGGPKISLTVACTGIILVVGLVLTIVARTGRFNRRWFASRAIAESVKTETWRFMMKTGTLGTQEATEAEKQFSESLRKIRDAQPEAHPEIARHVTGAQWITQKMRSVRAMPFRDRYSFYVENRLRDQIKWYKRKAVENRQAETRFFALGMIVHALAVAIIFLALSLNWVGLLTTMAASFFAWTQLRDHQQQAQSYTLIAQELAALDLDTAVNDDQALANLVEEVERTISREHTLWSARRLT